ncbi:hypothetical protein ACLIIZ_18050 [Azonexus caeni]|jgi:hypothetical protein|uniref:hypothetical protein n=1 Tax=Azonexus caeni TaxID=266126 RepID=UPI003A8844A4
MIRLLCLLLLGAALNCRAEPLGRLFFTPEQRRLLEQAPAAAPALAPGRLDGIVVGSSGLNLRWVDGQVETGGDSGQKVGDSMQQPLLPPGNLQIGAAVEGKMK